MPTYTYVCNKCGHEIEAFQSMSDPPLKRCKECRGALRRTFHPVGIVLKGSGFHKTDYRAPDKKREAESSSNSESKSTSDSAKTEKKKDSSSSSKSSTSSSD